MGQKEGVQMRRKRLDTMTVLANDIPDNIKMWRRHYVGKGINVQFELTELTAIPTCFILIIWEVK